MKVGQQDVSYPMECMFCGKKWLAVIEAGTIDWENGEEPEIHHGELLECPECGEWTPIENET